MWPVLPDSKLYIISDQKTYDMMILFLLNPAKAWYSHIVAPFSVQFSCSVVSDCLRPHGLQHARLPCPSLTPRAFSNSCPSSWWCHQTISFWAPFRRQLKYITPWSSYLKWLLESIRNELISGQGANKIKFSKGKIFLGNPVHGIRDYSSRLKECNLNFFPLNNKFLMKNTSRKPIIFKTGCFLVVFFPAWIEPLQALGKSPWGEWFFLLMIDSLDAYFWRAWEP